MARTVVTSRTLAGARAVISSINDRILMETGDFLLLEDDNKILTEESGGSGRSLATRTQI